MESTIIFEGTFCTGKTTQWLRARDYFQDRGYTVADISETNATREFIESLDSDGYTHKDMGPYTESFLWATHHMEKVEDIQRTDAEIILVDRFLHSTVAFQELLLDASIEEITEYLFTPFNDKELINYDLAIVFTADQESIAERFQQREGTEIPPEDLDTALQIQSNYSRLNEYIDDIVYIETSDLSKEDVWTKTREQINDIVF